MDGEGVRGWATVPRRKPVRLDKNRSGLGVGRPGREIAQRIRGSARRADSFIQRREVLREGDGKPFKRSDSFSGYG